MGEGAWETSAYICVFYKHNLSKERVLVSGALVH